MNEKELATPLMTDAEANEKLDAIDYATKEMRLGALEILKLIHAAFPLDKVMSPDFKGSHALHLQKDGRLSAMVWYDNKAHTVIFD